MVITKKEPGHTRSSGVGSHMEVSSKLINKDKYKQGREHVQQDRELFWQVLTTIGVGC
jgi:hypothetical protein